MNNGSERIKITNWVENVPVRGLTGEIIGRAKVSDKGEVQASIDISLAARETYQMLSAGLYDGLSIYPHATPVVPKYSDEVRSRLAQQNPFKKEN